MKKYFNILFTILLLIFSFYYTNKISNYLKSKDPIMINILNNKNKYEYKSINAIIDNNTIIPGKSSKTIDINKSYKKMKRINKYTESLLVFNYNKPDISIDNRYDKLIINGNNTNRNISILLKINDINILKKLKDDSLNFILDNNFIKNNLDYLTNIKNNIIILEQLNINNLNLIDYCYSNNIFYSYCKNYHKYTIKPTFINNNYYYNTNKLIKNGSILAYNINNNNLEELKIIISYIKTLNYKIVSIDNLIKE